MLSPININISNLFSASSPPEEVVKNIASTEGPVDVYCWYEGPRGLPVSGAQFMKEALFQPLFKLKKDAKLYLYSLRAWDFLNKTRMALFNPLGEAINRIDSAAIECIYSSEFFQFCSEQKGELYEFLSRELKAKTWLEDLSKDEKPCGKTVAELFKNQASLLDCVKEYDCNLAYSYMQYVEGYYLIRESVKRGLDKNQKRIEIAFVLPNDEGKYYRDFPTEIEKMLRLEFGQQLSEMGVNVNFQFFQYKLEEGLKSRPYIDRSKKVAYVSSESVGQYFY